MKKLYILALAAASLVGQSVSAQAAPTPVSGLLVDSGIALGSLTLTPSGSQVTADANAGGLYSVLGLSPNVGLLADSGSPFTLTESATLTATGGSTFSITNGTFTRSYNLSEGVGTLSGTFSGSGHLISFGDLTGASYKSDVTITGGTGVFAGVTGGIGSITGYGSFGSILESFSDQATISAVPLPGSIAMFGSALIGLIGLGRRQAKLSLAA